MESKAEESNNNNNNYNNLPNSGYCHPQRTTK